MSDLNLRAIAKDAIERAESVDYHDLANVVLAALSPEQMRDALAQALPTFVRDVAGSLRHTGPVRPPSVAPRLPGTWKQNAIRDNWQRQLSDIYATPEGNKRLGDFTRDDLLHQSNLLQTQAKQKMSKAKGWRALADLLAEHEAEHVRDLPAELLMTTLGAVA